MFTVLIAGVCGFMTDVNGEPFVTIGFIQGQECVRPVLTIANGVTTLPTQKFRHAVHVIITDTEAEVTIDRQTFKIPRNII
jgi:hypothetical protein